jgi:hypothetical protein
MIDPTSFWFLVFLIVMGVVIVREFRNAKPTKTPDERIDEAVARRDRCRQIAAVGLIVVVADELRCPHCGLSASQSTAFCPYR